MSDVDRIVDLFSGIGGWAVAAARRGIRTHGIDNNRHAVATYTAAGHDATLGSVLDAALIAALGTDIDGLTASAPCQPFSQATRGRGVADERGRLVYAPLAWVTLTRPRFVCFEQVRGALPYFVETAHVLTQLGYSTATGVLNAADYGVPQARKRAVMIASRERDVTLPEPTHGTGRTPHVTLADALPYRTDLPTWAHERPSMTVVGTFEPEVIAAPGYRKPGDPPRQKTPNSVRTTQAERLVLQSFAADHPVSGPKSARDLQIGNAIPPLLAGALLDACR